MNPPDSIPSKNALVVLAHPEPSSFAAALAQTAHRTFLETGWDTTLLDLYAEDFDPRLSERDFTARAVVNRLQPMDEQLHAARTNSFAPDLARHIELLEDADILVLASPIWWFSLPAMMKGWIDRVLANGIAYVYPDVRPWTGPLNEKRAMLALTSSYEASSFGKRSLWNLEEILYPVLHGTLAYCGMQVLDPFVAYAADSAAKDTLRGYLEAFEARIRSLDPVPAATQ